jgi:DNA-binding GntR family transcriptional regulator
VDHSSSSEPFYRQMYNELAASIRAGRYAVGTALPTERELCASFGVSRHTAREALRQLEQRGLISRRQGSGSTVIARTPPVRYEQAIQSIDDLMQQGQASRLEVLDASEFDDQADQFASQITRVAKAACVRVRSIRHLRNDVRPLALVDVYAAVRSKARARRLLDTATAASEIVAMVDPRKLDRVEQAFTAVALDPEPARLLYVQPGDPAFRTIRHYYDASGRLIVVAHSLYQGPLFTYTSTLRRS